MTWPSASGGGYDRQVDPGDVNPPAIFEPSTSIIQGSSPQLRMAASGGKNWGGALVSVSFDGVNYDYVGTLTSPAFQGLLTAGITNSGSPLSVDLTQSAGVLPTAATHADQVAKRTLSYICPAYVISGGSATVPGNGELLAYGAVAATGTYTNNLTDLNRGLYGTAAASHSSGDFFTRIDLGELDTPPNSVLTYTLPPQYIGATVHVKFQSFNVFGNATQDISAVVEYTYTPSGAGYGGGTGGAPTTPTGLTASPATTSNALEWTANPSGDNVTAYRLFRAAGTGASFGSAALIAQVTALNYADTGLPSNTGYTYFLEAVNAIGASAAAAGVNATTTAAGLTSGRRVTTTGGTLALTNTDSYVDISNSTGVLEIDLPTSSLTVGQRIVMTDEGGTAGALNWTIKSSGTTIDTVTVNGGFSAVRWNGTHWLISV